MKVLIAVKSSMKGWMGGMHEPIRESWGSKAVCTKDNHVHLKFFFGNDSGWLLGPYPDEIHIDAPDGYTDLSKKVKKICEYAVAGGYDYVYICDTDTFCIVDRLMDILRYQPSFDYGGWIVPWKPKFAFGGCGYVLSNRAAQIIAEEPVRDPLDDISIGRVLYGRPGIVTLDALSGFHRGVAWHFPKNVYAVKTYDPKFPWMRLMAEKHLGMTFNDEPKIPIIGEKKVEPNAWREWPVVIGGASRIVRLTLTGEDLVDDYDDIILMLRYT